MKTKRLEGRHEEIIDPDLPIVDSHYHLFDLPGNRYMVEDYLSDINSGHNIVASVYCETQSFSRKDGPEWMRPIGEVEFANGIGAMTSTGVYGKARICAGIIGHANLTFGSKVGELLDRCLQTAPERYRGVRHVTVEYPTEAPFQSIMTYKPPAGVLDSEGFPLGLAEVQKRGLSFDAGVYDPSIPKLTAMIDRFPYLTFVLDHLGCPVGIGMSDQEKASVFRSWSTSIRELARRQNVNCKVGGLGMPPWGFGFELREDEIGYVELAEAWRPYIEMVIEAFGVDRCMMESNFPPDGRSCGFVPLWNALKYVTRDYSQSEKATLFHGTATRVYRLGPIDGIS